MRELDEGLVREVWEELSGLDAGGSEAEARAFIDGQPHLVALAGRVTAELDQEAQKSALGLLFLLTKVVEAARGAPVPPVSEGRVRAAYEATAEWLDRWDGADPRFLERSGEFPQPHLITYLVDGFYRGGPGPEEHEAEVKGNLFLLLKTAAEALETP